MCGIAGIINYRFDPPAVDKGELLRVREAMSVRGPDGAGLWISDDRQTGLAHRRLSIIDLSEAGAQPMADSSGKLRVVFNGEIYNYRDLRAQLERRGHIFFSKSDTEVLLHLYREFGLGLFSHLRGMYAIALWDEDRKVLLLARDPLGIKPLYFADNGKTLRFASQVKALVAGRGLDTSGDPAGYVGFFLWGHVPEPYTLYKRIRSLPPGCAMEIKYGQFGRIFRYANALKVLRGESDESPACENLRDSMLDSVAHHQIADVPVGLFLSAGVDSTTLCSLMRETNTAPPQTITLGFEEYRTTPLNEVPLAEVAAAHYQTNHQTRWVSKREFQDSLPHMLAHMDQPSTDGANTYFVSKVAAESGLKVAISGVGGDEWFGGYPSFQQIPKLIKAVGRLRVPSGLGKVFRVAAAPALKYFTSPKYAGLLEYGGSWGGAYLLRRSMYMPWELPDFLDGDLVQEGWSELQTLAQLEATATGMSDDHSRVTALEMQWYLQSRLLRDADWAGMAHSLEIRTPLVDWEAFKTVAFHLRHNSGLLNKQNFASIPKQRLPKAIADRPKSGFGVPLYEWFLRQENGGGRERGLRGWAKFIGREFCLI